MSCSLTDAPLHAPVEIRHVGGDRAFRRRLMELGLVPGTMVTVVGVAPMGDPLDLSVRGGRLSIRRQEAQALTVEREGSALAAR